MPFLLSVPPLGDGPPVPSADELLRSVLDYDQYDDWLTDVVYYEDTRRNLAAAAQELDPWVRPGGLALSATGMDRLQVPRTAGRSMPAAFLPLRSRMMVRSAAAMLEGRLNVLPGALSAVRQKVYGFRYQPGSPALFQAPGAELE